MSPALLIQAWGGALVNFVWQGLVVGAVAALLLALLRGASARWRYAVCGLSLLLCLGLPLAPLLGGAAAVESDLADDLAAQMAAQMPALVSAWALGAGLMSARLGLGLAWVARARRRALPAPAHWQARLDALAQRLGLRRPVQLRLLPELAGPIAVGWLRPCVLLPAALLTRLPADLLEALLAHELAHVRRSDYLANLLQSAVEALLFFHPVVWWLSARMRTERELVADEISAELLGSPRRLAQALHALSELQPQAAPPLALAASGGDLLWRVERLLAPRPQATGWKLALPALLIAATSFVVQAAGRSPADAPVHSAQGLVTQPPPPPAAAPLKLPVNAKHVLVVDDSTGQVLMARDADTVVPIASLTKLLTAMVVLDAKQDPDEKLRIAPEDVDLLKHSRSRAPVGSQMTRQAALEMALLASENRAASALARTFPGGEAAFVKAVQAKVRSLGLSRTTIAEPTGLSPANTSTATEVAAITAAASRYAEIARITSAKRAQVGVNGRPREVSNTNRLVGAKGWDIRLSKTGYTEEAGRCLTMRMLAAKRPVTVVLLDADGSAQRLRDAALIRKSLGRV